MHVAAGAASGDDSWAAQKKLLEEKEKEKEKAMAGALAKEQEKGTVVEKTAGPVVGTVLEPEVEKAAGPVTGPVVGPTVEPMVEQEDDSMCVEMGGMGEEEEEEENEEDGQEQPMVVEGEEYPTSEEQEDPAMDETESERVERDKLSDQPCVECGSLNNERETILCDGCGGAYHMYCLNPVLMEVPEEDVSRVHCWSRIDLHCIFLRKVTRVQRWQIKPAV